MCSQPGLKGPGWASETEQSVTSIEAISLQAQDYSQTAKSFISSSNEVSLGRSVHDFRVGNLLRPDESCGLLVDVRQPDTHVAFLDTLSRAVQTSRLLVGLSLDFGHVDTDIDHVARSPY